MANLMTQFEDIVGYEGLYEINRQGHINTLPRTKYGKGSCIYETKKKRMTPVKAPNGYMSIILIDEVGHNQKYYIHRLNAIQFIDNPENKPEVNHKDGIKHHNGIDNLEWNTKKENVEHAKRLGLYAIGEDAYNSKLKDVEVMVIKELLRDNMLKANQIAKYFNVSAVTISNIKHGKKWSHIY